MKAQMSKIGSRTLLLFCLFSPLLARAEGATDDWTLLFGDMRPGSGLAAGVEYFSSHFENGFFDLRLESKLSIRLYQQHEAEIVFPHLLGERLFVEALGVYRSYTQIDYFGVGPDSREEDHSDYRLNGGAWFTSVGLRPYRQLAVGTRVGMLRSSLGQGRDDDLPSIEDVFDPATLPGLVEQPDFLVLGWFASLDLRDDRQDPTRGIFYQGQMSLYRDSGSGEFDFQQLEAEARHYVPLGPRFTLALRARGLFTWTGKGRRVPFFLLPSLGGTANLHAFENDRFRDRNLLVFSNEVRYRATPEIQIETFFDFGQVFPRFSELGGFVVSTGLGAHYKYGRNILLGVILGVGREGPRLALTGDLRF